MCSYCGQTNTPDLDETPLVCDEFIDTSCVTYQPAIAYLGLAEDSTMTEVIEALLASLIDARNRIIILENT